MNLRYSFDTFVKNLAADPKNNQGEDKYKRNDYSVIVMVAISAAAQPSTINKLHGFNNIVKSSSIKWIGISNTVKLSDMSRNFFTVFFVGHDSNSMSNN